MFAFVFLCVLLWAFLRWWKKNARLAVSDRDCIIALNNDCSPYLDDLAEVNRKKEEQRKGQHANHQKATGDSQLVKEEQDKAKPIPKGSHWEAVFRVLHTCTLTAEQKARNCYCKFTTPVEQSDFCKTLVSDPNSCKHREVVNLGDIQLGKLNSAGEENQNVCRCP
uniref:Uncharacterized protein n=1 Tax=Ditylenchus dipsaci TaxID=166011 RepID=A0A915E1H0_9BILA